MSIIRAFSMNEEENFLTEKISRNFPENKKIPVVFYQCRGEANYTIENIERVFSITNIKGNIPLKIHDTKTLINLFEKFHFLNFIKLNDVEKHKELNIQEVSPQIIFSQIMEICSGANNLDKDPCPFEVYTLHEEDYDDNIRGKCNFIVINASGNIDIFSKEEEDILKEKIKEKKNVAEKIIYKDEIFDTLDKFVNFFVRSSRILFLSKNEDYKTITLTKNGEKIEYTTEVLYPKVKDQKPIDLYYDLEAIYIYTTKSKRANLYNYHSLWGEYFLQKEADGLSVIDSDFTILYANEKRRQRHKNNILGKKCHQVFCKNPSICEKCIFLNYDFFLNSALPFDEQDLTTINDLYELELTDKADNTYHLTEYNRIVSVNCYSKLLGISE